MIMQRGSVNKVILVGRLGQVPEIRYAPSGTAIANFSIATNEVRRDKDGNNQESTDWHRIVAFGKTAEFIQQYIKKGDMIYVEGRLQTRNWEDKDGVKRNVTEILSSAVTPLSSSGGRSGEGGASQGSNYGGNRASNNHNNVNYGGSGSNTNQNQGNDAVNDDAGGDYFGDDPLPF